MDGYDEEGQQPPGVTSANESNRLEYSEIGMTKKEILC
jgi:hypothetical protein